MTLGSGGSQTLVAQTENYSSHLYDDAKGKPLKFSITFFKGSNAVLGPFTAEIPSWETLSNIDNQETLLLDDIGAPIPQEGKAVAAKQREKMASLNFLPQ